MIDIVIIGGGAAGLAALKGAYDASLNILLIEREKNLGGILRQCIHNGFGLHHFKEELTGPEYAEKSVDAIEDYKVDILTNTTVQDIEKNNDHFKITYTNETEGLTTITALSVIVSTGCYERTRGQIKLPGDRPKGIMNAGSAQRYLNIDGYLVGKKIFILGSGDIGLIMARRMTLEGATVSGVAEIMPHANGLTRNIVQCLHDFDIPLYLSHTVTNIIGKDNLESITISEVDDSFKPIKGTEKHFDVDTLLLSVGLIPDIQMFDSLSISISERTGYAIVDQTYQSSVRGLYICGNALHVHDLVDYVSEESEQAGLNALTYVKGERHKHPSAHLDITHSENINYTIPQKIDYNLLNDTVTLSLRTKVNAHKGVFTLTQNNTPIYTKKATFITPGEMERLIIPAKNIKPGVKLEVHFEGETHG